MGIVVGIDASRNRSGGAKTHLLGILKDSDPLDHGIREVHVWSYKDLLDALPNAEWLVKHNPPELERSLLRQVWWQYRSLPRGSEISFAPHSAHRDCTTDFRGMAPLYQKSAPRSSTRAGATDARR